MKKLKLYVIALLAALVSFGAAGLIKTSAAQLSAPANIKFNTATNILTWDAVEHASGYKYRIGSGEWVLAAKPAADLGFVVQQAAQAAKAAEAPQASFNVEIIAEGDGFDNSAAGTFSYTFDKYTQMELEYDIADILTLDGNGEYHIDGAKSIYGVVLANRVISFGFRPQVKEEQRNHTFYLYNNQWGNSINVFHNLGWFNFSVRNAGEASVKMSPADLSFNFKTKPDGTVLYASVGVMDLFNLNGEKVSERVVFDSWTYEAGKRVTFFEPAPYDNDNYHLNTTRVERMATLDSGAAPASQTMLSSALVNKLSAPALLGLDEATNTLYWNSVEGASGYKWNVNGGAWTQTADNYADVTSAVNAVRQSSGKKADFKVFAVSGGTQEDSNPALIKKDLKLKVVSTGTVDTAKQISAASGTFINPSSAYSTPSKTLSATNLSRNQTWQLSFIYTKLEEDAVNNGEIYVLILPEDLHYGTAIRIYQRSYSTNNAYIHFGTEREVHHLQTPFEIGRKYTLTYGLYDVDNLESGETKTALRLDARITALADDGTAATVFSHHKDYLPTAVRGTETGYVRYEKNYGDQLAWAIAATPTMERDYNVTLFSGSDLVGTRTLSYEKTYDLTGLRPAPQYGYKFESWYYLEGDEKVFVPEKGLWTKDFLDIVDDEYSGVLLAEFTETAYDVTYNLDGKADNAPSNPNKYDITSRFILQNPINIESGYIFEGWYLDSEYTEKITEINERSGDIALYAKFAEGWKLTFVSNKAQTVYVPAGETYTMPTEFSVPAGYTLGGWQLKQGDSYADFENAQVTPAEDMTFKAVWQPIEYAVTYELSGGTNHAENLAKFTVESNITFAPAVKDGSNFDGWFTDAAFKNRITSTLNLNKNITVYAKFVADGLPEKLTFVISSNLKMLPVPYLPDGAAYSLKLYLKSDTERASPLSLTDTIGYKFEKAEVYVAVYTLDISGEQSQKTVEITVQEGSEITISGTYSSAYHSGTTLTVYGAEIAGGGTVTITVKKDGAQVAITGNKVVLTTGSYEIIYTDAAGAAQTKSVSFTVTDAPETDNKSGCKSTAGIVGVMAAALISGAALIVFAPRKKHEK